MTTLTASTTTAGHTAPGRRFAVGAALSAAAFIVLLTLAGLLDPGYSPLSEGISALGSTESQSAPIMTLGFLALGATAVGSGLALIRALTSRLARAAGVLVVVSGLLSVVDGLLPQSCSTLQQSCLDREAAGQVSSAHVLHNLVALPLFGFLVIAGFLLAFGVRRTDRLRHRWVWALLGAVGTFVLLVWFGSSAFGSIGGLVQRMLVLGAYGLPLAVARAASRRVSSR